MSKYKRNMEIIKLRQQGYSLKQIADKYSISKDRVSDICRKAQEQKK